MPLRHLSTNWDTADDWTDWDDSQIGEVVATRVASPTRPYRGGMGRLASNFTATGGSYSWSMRADLEDIDYDHRAIRATFATRIPELVLGGDREGPFMLIGYNDTGTGVGQAVYTETTGTLATPTTGAEITIAGIPVQTYQNQWIVWDIAAISKDPFGHEGQKGGDYSLEVFGVAYVDRGTRLQPIGEMDFTLVTGTEWYGFQAFEIGFRDNIRTEDSLTIEVDEFSCQAGPTIPDIGLPRSRRAGWPTTQ